MVEDPDMRENTGRWTPEEHRMFEEGLRKYGKQWKKIAATIPSRTVVQIRTHAQKYFLRLAKSGGAVSSSIAGKPKVSISAHSGMHHKVSIMVVLPEKVVNVHHRGFSIGWRGAVCLTWAPFSLMPPAFR